MFFFVGCSLNVQSSAMAFGFCSAHHRSVSQRRRWEEGLTVQSHTVNTEDAGSSYRTGHWDTSIR